MVDYNGVNYYMPSLKERFGDNYPKYNFIIMNKPALDDVLSKSNYKEAILHCILNEGYVSNELNQGYTVNADSVVVARNPAPEKVPGTNEYKTINGFSLNERGNFGLDEIGFIVDELSDSIKNSITTRQVLDNYSKTKDGKRIYNNVSGVDRLSLKDAVLIYNKIFEKAENEMKKQYGDDAVNDYFAKYPMRKTQFLYAFYRNQNKFYKYLKNHKTIDGLYEKYNTVGGQNESFRAVKNNWGMIEDYFKYRRGGIVHAPIPITNYKKLHDNCYI